MTVCTYIYIYIYIYMYIYISVCVCVCVCLCVIYIFPTNVLIFVAMFMTMFRQLYAPAFFRWLKCPLNPFFCLLW